MAEDDPRVEDLLEADITEHQRAFERLRESEDRLRLAAEAADVGTWDLKPASGQLRWDERCKRFFGLPPEAEVTYESSSKACTRKTGRGRIWRFSERSSQTDPANSMSSTGRSASRTKSSAGSPPRAAQSSRAKAHRGGRSGSSAPSSTSATSAVRRRNSVKKAARSRRSILSAPRSRASSTSSASSRW